MKKRRLFILPAFIKVLLTCFSALIPGASHAQDGGDPKVEVILKILKIGYNDVDKKKKARPVWKFYYPDKAGISLTNPKAGDCYEFKSKRKNDDDDVKDEESEVRSFIAPLPSFSILMECYASTRGGSTCTFDQKDQEHSLTSYTLDPVMNKLFPGDWSSEFKIVDNKNAFFAVCKYKYTLSEIGRITCSNKEIVVSADQATELNLTSPIPNKETLPFIWEYSFDNSSWKVIHNSNADRSILKLDPAKDIFEGKLETTKKIYFHASLDNKGIPIYSDTISLSFTPAPPRSNDTTTFSSCHGAASGRILVRNIKSSSGRISYLLRKGDDLKALCELQDTTKCPGFLKKDYAPKGSNIDLVGLQAGKYNLIIYNSEMEVGHVYTSFNFNIDELPELKIKPNSIIRPPDCNNEKGGGISLVVEGGKNIWQIILNPKNGNLTWHGGDAMSIDDLPSGSYTLELTDKCGNLASKNFSLRKPRRLAIDSVELHSKPLELAVILKSQSGSGNYKLTVTDPNRNQKTTDNISDINIPFLDAGPYRIQITDNAYPTCPSIDTTITIKKAGSAKSPKYQIDGQDGAGIYFRIPIHLQKAYVDASMISLNRRKFLNVTELLFDEPFFV